MPVTKDRLLHSEKTGSYIVIAILHVVLFPEFLQYTDCLTCIMYLLNRISSIYLPFASMCLNIFQFYVYATYDENTHSSLASLAECKGVLASHPHFQKLTVKLVICWA